MDVVITQKGLDLLGELEKENEQMDNRLSALNEQEITHLNFLLDKLRIIVALLPYILYPLSFIFSEDFPLLIDY